MYTKGRAWIEINETNLVNNVKNIQNILHNDCKLMPAVKANAYGHGLVIIAKLLQNLGIFDFCVATANEGIELRNAGVSGQILVLSYTHPEQFIDLYQFELTQAVVDYNYAIILNSFTHHLKVHVCIDTGMRRLGERSEDIKKIFKIWKFQNLEITGVFSHLCSCDGQSQKEREFTIIQINRFQTVINALHQGGISGFSTHLQGSYGVLNYPDLFFDYARVGIALYGALSSSDRNISLPFQLTSVLSLKARIEIVKKLYCEECVGYGLTYTANSEKLIASVSIGYADGIPRSLSNKGYVLLHGKKAPIIGQICMDQLLIDVTNIPTVLAGDEVILIGKSGDLEITTSIIAEQAKTISNEILSCLGSRLERIIV